MMHVSAIPVMEWCFVEPGLLEMETKAGGYGTVRGMNGLAADVAC